jgi:hypothetical protein
MDWKEIWEAIFDGLKSAIAGLGSLVAGTLFGTEFKTETGAISVFETIKHKDGNFEVENHLTGVSLTSNKVDYSAEDLTARDLSFNAEANREIVANEEIK